MKLLFAILVAVPIFCLSFPAIAGEGRYQAISMGPGGLVVLILDTKDGHLWTWNTGGTTGATGACLVYQGKVAPGEKLGGVIDGGPPPRSASHLYNADMRSRDETPRGHAADRP